MRGGAEGRRDRLAAVVDGVRVVAGRQAADAVRWRRGRRRGSGGRRRWGCRRPVLGDQVLPSSSVKQVSESTPVSWDSKRAAGRAVGEEDRVEALGAALRAAAGGVGRGVASRWPRPSAKRDPVGREVGLVDRGAGLEAVADRRLTGVVVVVQGARRLVVAERRAAWPCRAPGRPACRPGLRGRGVGARRRGEGHHAHGVVAGPGRGEDQLGVGARGGGRDDVALRVEQVEVEVGGRGRPGDPDLQLVVPARSPAGASTCSVEVVAGVRAPSSPAGPARCRSRSAPRTARPSTTPTGRRRPRRCRAAGVAASGGGDVRRGAAGERAAGRAPAASEPRRAGGAEELGSIG